LLAASTGCRGGWPMLGRSAAARRAAELLHLMHLGVTRHMAQLMNVYGSELFLKFCCKAVEWNIHCCST